MFPNQRNMFDWGSCCAWRTILVLLKNPWVVVYTREKVLEEWQVADNIDI